jgi:hypothetical protein
LTICAAQEKLILISLCLLHVRKSYGKISLSDLPGCQRGKEESLNETSKPLRSSRIQRGKDGDNHHSPVPEGGVKIKYQLFFGVSKDPALQIRSQVIRPPKATALATTQ